MKGNEYDLRDFVEDMMKERAEGFTALGFGEEADRVKRVFDLLAQKVAVHGRVELHEIGTFKLGKRRKFPRNDRPGLPETYRKVKFNAAPDFERRVQEIVNEEIR